MQYSMNAERSIAIGQGCLGNALHAGSKAKYVDVIAIGAKIGAYGGNMQRNIIIGDSAARYIYSNENVFIGFKNAMNLTTGYGNVWLGNYVGYNSNDTNTLKIDNSDTSKTLIYGEFDNDRLKVNGRLAVSTYIVNTSSVTLGNGYSFVDVDYTSTGTVTINLPTDNTEGDVLVITDTGGNASVNNITINGNGANISGSSTYMLQVSYESVQMHYHNGNWFVY